MLFDLAILLRGYDLAQVVGNFLAIIGFVVLDDVIVFVEGFVGIFVIDNLDQGKLFVWNINVLNI